MSTDGAGRGCARPGPGEVPSRGLVLAGQIRLQERACGLQLLPEAQRIVAKEAEPSLEVVEIPR